MNLSYDEYDALLADPENFKSASEIDNEIAQQEEAARQAQVDVDRAFAQSIVAAEQAEERERIEREQRELAKRRKEEGKRRKEEERQRELARAEMAKRLQQEKESETTINKTTKPCLACEAPTQKVSGW